MKDFLIGLFIVALITVIASVIAPKTKKVKHETYCRISIFTNDSTTLNYTAKCSKVNIRNGSIYLIDEKTGEKSNFKRNIYLQRTKKLER